MAKEDYYTGDGDYYDVEVRYWSKDRQEFMDYRVTCRKGGLIVDSPSYGHTQYKGENIRNIIAEYRRSHTGYRWTKRPCTNPPTPESETENPPLQDTETKSDG